MTEKKMQNPYYTLGEAFVASVVAGNRGKITGNQIGLSDRLRQYAYYLTENMVETGDGLLVNDLLDAARQLERRTPIQPLTSPDRGQPCTKARETDPAELWDRYCEETPVARRTPQGAMAFAFDAITPAIQPQRMRETLESARDYIASVNFYAAGTPAYIKNCEHLIAIDAALAHTRPECGDGND